MTLIAEGLDDLARHGLASEPKAALARIAPAASAAEAVRDADFVQESLPEEIELKRRIFAELDRAAPAGAILASSTSAIPASSFTEALAGRARCLVAHPVNPPHLVPLVELSGAPWTAPETVARAKALFESVGQVPIVVRREIEGFILNRLQGALLAEALRLVGEGYVSPDDLDKTVRDGLGLRWSFIGPIETIELNAPAGIADYWRRYAPFYRRLAAAPAGTDAWDERIRDAILSQRGAAPAAAALDRKQAWRDRRLMALVAHKRGQPKFDEER
jgi:3-hydroxyacyl-CoA dehydrogenase